MPTKVYLLGEMHDDLEKTARYKRALSYFDPDFITTENTEPNIRKEAEQFDECIQAHWHHLRSDKNRNFLATRDYMFGDCALFSYVKETNLEQQCQRFVWPIDIRNNLEQKLQQLANQKLPDESTLKLLASISANQHYRGVIYSNALKKNHIHSAQELRNAFIDVCLHGLPKDLDRMQFWFDCLYYLPKDVQETLSFDVENRDDHMAKEILSFDGVVFHSSGIEHVYGNYHNLYERLRKAKIPVERHMLIEFAKDNAIRSFIYRQQIKYTAKHIVWNVNKWRKKHIPNSATPKKHQA